MVNELGKTSSVLSQFIAEIRDENIQQDRLRFRRNLERVGEIMAYEISKTFTSTTKMVTTPLGEAEEVVPNEEIVLATILRAGLPLQQGLLNYLDHADCAFVSAFRKYISLEEFKIEVEYIASTSIDGKILILSDPMVATGSSVELAYKAILSKGEPKHIHVVTAIASKQGVNHVRQHLPKNITIWAGAVDNELTAKSYIVPGLGDAGDLAFGMKD